MNIREYMLLQILDQNQPQRIANGYVSCAVEGQHIVMSIGFPGFPGFMCIAFHENAPGVITQYVKESINKAELEALNTKLVPPQITHENKPDNVILFPGKKK